MSRVFYIILASAVILILIVIFVVSYVMYRKTPPPKGCENVPSPDNCSECGLGGACSLNLYAKEAAKSQEGKKEDGKK
jgi:flagellar basal body-associated protein FliL